MRTQKLFLLALFGFSAFVVYAQEVFDLKSATKLVLTQIPMFDEYGNKVLFVFNVEFIEDLCGDSTKDMTIVNSGQAFYHHWIQNGTAVLEISDDYDLFDESWLSPFDNDEDPDKEYLTSRNAIIACNPTDTSVLSLVETPDCLDFARTPQSIDIDADGFVDVAGYESNSAAWYKLIMGGDSYLVCDSVKFINSIENQVPVDLPFRVDDVYSFSMPLGQDSAKKIYLNQLTLNVEEGQSSGITIVDSILAPAEGSTIYSIRQYSSLSSGRTFVIILWRNVGQYGLLKLYEVINKRIIEVSSVVAENIVRLVNIKGSRNELVPLVAIEFYNPAVNRSELHIFRIDNITHSFAYTDDYYTLPPTLLLIPDQNQDDFPDFLVSNFIGPEQPLAIADFKDGYYSALPVGVDEQPGITMNQIEMNGSRLSIPSSMRGEIVMSVYSSLGQRILERRLESNSESVYLDQWPVNTAQPVIVVLRCGEQIASRLLLH